MKKDFLGELKAIGGGLNKPVLSLNQETKKQFNKFDNKIFNLVDLNNTPLHIYGSYIHEGEALFAGDIDLGQEVDFKQLKPFLKRLRELIKKLLDSNDYLIKDIQIGAEMFTPKQFLKMNNKEIKNILLKQDLIKKKDSFFDTKFIKFDASKFDGKYFRDFSGTYTFEDIEKFNTVETVKKNIEEYIEKGNYFKALKRVKLLGKYKDEVNFYLLNPILASIYLIISKLDTLINSANIPVNLFNLSIENLKNDLRKMGLLSSKYLKIFDNPTKEKLTLIHDELKKSLNKKAIEFFKKHYDL